MTRDDDGPWWRGAVIYQIYPRSFADADGDGVGDLAGIAAHLPYVAALGVDAIWLSPVFRSPMVDAGYDVSDYRDIDPVFGSLRDFDALVAEAHRLGLRVVLDQVYSHTSDRHPWFEASRQGRGGERADWYVWADPAPGGGPPNNWQCWFGEAAWSWEPRRSQYYLHNFHPKMPDLNFLNPSVVDETLATARFWLDRDVDGLRLDVCNYYLHDAELRDNPPKAVERASKPFFLQRHLYNCDRPENLATVAALRAVLDSYDDRFAVAEIVSEDNLGRAAEYTSGPQRLHTAYSFAFFGDWPGAEGFAAVMRAYGVEPDVWPSFAFSNHDVIRVASRWGQGEPAAARLFLALLLTLRGTIFLYQGEELGLLESEVPFERIIDPSGLAGWPLYKGRDGCRTPFPWDGAQPANGFSAGEPWLPADPAQGARSVAAQAGDPLSMLELARDLIGWRRRTPAVRGGAMTLLAAPEPLVAFRRGEALTCAFNPGPVPQAFGLGRAGARMGLGERAGLSGDELWLGPWGWAVVEG